MKQFFTRAIERVKAIQIDWKGIGKLILDGIKGTMAWPKSVAIMIWEIVIFPFLKSLYEIWLEFWFIRYENGETIYKASWKKIWAQLAQVALYASIYGLLHLVIRYLRGYNTKEELETVAGIAIWAIPALTTHAVAMMGYYKSGKKDEIDKFIQAQNA